MTRSLVRRAAARQPAVEVARATPHVLREYASLGGGERGILVGPRGDFGWMCFPSRESDGVFSSLIDGSGASHSCWVTEDNAVIECREALAQPARPDRAVVPRRVVAIRGSASMEVSLQPCGELDRGSGVSTSHRAVVPRLAGTCAAELYDGDVG